MKKFDKKFVDDTTLYAADLNEIVDAVNAGYTEIDKKVDSVSGKGLSTNDFTTAEKNKLSTVESGAEKNTVTSVANKKGVVVLAKDDVGLGNVDNTADVDKPISNAAKEYFVAKEEGKGLSTNDLTDELHKKLGEMPNFIVDGDGRMFLSNDGTYKKGGGAGGGFYNVTQMHPLSSGYYTKETAISALANAEISDEDKVGMIITFQSSDDTWEDYRFVGSISGFSSPSAWEEFGAKDVVKSVGINGGKVLPDSSGNVNLLMDVIEVDESLDEQSTNPVANKVIASKIKEIERGTVASIESEIDEDNNIIKITLYNKEGLEIDSTEFAGGTGGEEGEQGTATKIILTSSIDNPIIKEGSSVNLEYFYDHQYSSGEDIGMSTGQTADITITIKNGAVTTFEQTYLDQKSGTTIFDISKYMKMGMNDVYVKAVTVNPEGKTQTKQSYTTVRVMSLTLSSSFNISQNLAGFAENASVDIPYTIVGAGNKELLLYVDGIQKDSKVITKSGQTNGTFSVSLNSYAKGRHTIQMVAYTQASDYVTITSDSVYFDIYKKGTNEPHIATKISFNDGTIFEQDHLTPTIKAGQFSLLFFEFAVYNPIETPTNLEVYQNNKLKQTISANRAIQTFTERYTEKGSYNYKFQCEKVEYLFYINVEKADIDLEEAKGNLELKLLSAGRSNAEANPAVWEYEDIKTVFSNFDWATNGWMGDHLLLTNGAAIEVLYKPFEKDPTKNGFTYEMEFKCEKVLDISGVVAECFVDDIGVQIKAHEAVIKASGGSSVNTPFSANLSMKVAFVIQPSNGSRLLELYVNGIRCGCERYGANESFLQPNPANIKVNSDNANVLLMGMRMYSRALTDDEVLSNYIVDRSTIEEMTEMYEKNDILDESGNDISIASLRKQGKSVVRIVGDLLGLNIKNDKKLKMPADVYFYSQYGKERDFVAYNAEVSLQGTSSMTYPRKNYKIKLKKSELYINGVYEESKKYAMRESSIPTDVFTMKAEFADHSGTHNTGIAILANDTWKEVTDGNDKIFMVPPQKYNPNVRVSIDGLPCNVYADNNNDGNDTYLGRYVFNNEKGGCPEIYGFEGVVGLNDKATLNGAECKTICIEFLNNTSALNLFDSNDMSTFDEGLEYRYPEDVYWKDNTASAYVKDATSRLWLWVNSCKGNPEKFKEEVADYFNVNNLCLWYVHTDYFMSVDQRVKNVMLATWDGVEWYFIPYDNKTQLGLRNDGRIAYPYNITDATIDPTLGTQAFAGYNSVLWTLVRENLKDELAYVAQKYRTQLTTTRTLDVLNNELMKSWSEREYNKDGEFKYIKPALEGVEVQGEIKTYEYLYSLHGSRFAHRTYLVNNRFALLDAKYMAGMYKADNWMGYFAWNFTASPKKIYITASEPYYFGYGAFSGLLHQTGVEAKEAGDIVSLDININLAIGDPQTFFGASRIAKLDLTHVSMAMRSQLALNQCVALQELDLSCPSEDCFITSINLNSCQILRKVNVLGAVSLETLSLTKNNRLEYFNGSKSGLTSVSLAKGCPLHTLILPKTISGLYLYHHKDLTYQNKTEGTLTIEGYDNIKTVVIDGCPEINWEQLLTDCKNVKNIRVTGIDIEGDATLLKKYQNIGGVDEDGNNVSTCRLVGKYWLTRTISDVDLAFYKERFPELKISQPEFTMIEFDDYVVDPANISNLDNETGYKFGNEYQHSSHITAILNKRHRYMTRFGADEEAYLFPLHDIDSQFYADANAIEDCTEADLTGADGEIFIYEPGYWYKGINDVINRKKYSCFSANEEMPRVPKHTVVTYESLKESEHYKEGMYFKAREATLDTSKYITNNNYEILSVDVEGYKRVRFPLVEGSDDKGAMFVDEENNSVGNIIMGAVSTQFANGMYGIVEIPEKAKRLVFTRMRKDPYIENVLLFNSMKIEDTEPEWVWHEPCLVAVMRSSMYRGKLSSVTFETDSLGAALYGITYPQALQELNARKILQFIDYESTKDIANLFMAKYGNRCAGNVVGRGYIDYRGLARTSFLRIGMKDTSPNPNANQNMQGSNKTTNQYGEHSYANMGCVNVLGYINLGACGSYDFVEGLGRHDETGVGSKAIVERPDGTKEYISWVNTNETHYASNFHQKRMDMILAGTLSGGSTVRYTNTFSSCTYDPNNPIYVNAFGRYASHWNSDGYFSYSFSFRNSNDNNYKTRLLTRLAFRGNVNFCQSVSEFKQIEMKY